MAISNDDTLAALAAIQTLVRLGIAAGQVVALMEGPEPTEEDVRAALDRGRNAIQRAREIK